MEKDEIVDLAVSGITAMLEESRKQPETRWTFEYSPETFCFTEPDFALEICERVLDVWQPTPENKAILNLPATVEVAMPNVYADQIEWFCRNLSRRDSVIISVHPHNDRGRRWPPRNRPCWQALIASRVACSAMASAPAMSISLRWRSISIRRASTRSFISRRCAPWCERSNIAMTCRFIRATLCGRTGPYCFSGSHQDAIRKGFAAHQSRNDGIWEMPYLPIDPKDIGESYEAVIRVNSQSGKGGVAWVLEQDRG